MNYNPYGLSLPFGAPLLLLMNKFMFLVPIALRVIFLKEWKLKWVHVQLRQSLLFGMVVTHWCASGYTFSTVLVL